jgi:hypothetical protein
VLNANIVTANTFNGNLSILSNGTSNITIQNSGDIIIQNDNIPNTVRLVKNFAFGSPGLVTQNTFVVTNGEGFRYTGNSAALVANVANNFAALFESRYYANGNTQSPRVIDMYCSNGNLGIDSDTANGQSYGKIRQLGYSNNAFADVSSLDFNSKTNYGNGTIEANINWAAISANSNIKLDFDYINLDGDVSVNGQANIYSNGYIQTTNRLEYLRTFGSFTSNATQTSAGANSVNYMTLNNTESANGISIANSSQITVSRTGTYNIQFSAQVTHDTNATANVEIWLTKNGNAIANTNSRLTLAKDQPTIAAWNWMDTVGAANDYYQVAWASPDTNMELIAIDAANTVANVNIPSVIVTVVPVGA